MTESTEGSRWFHIEQDRKRERAAWIRRARTRARTFAERAQAMPGAMPRHRDGTYRVDV